MPSLTLDRIFNDPDLSGSPPESLRFSPDAQYVSFLKPSAEDFERLDIWAFETATGKATMLVDSAKLEIGNRALSDEEKAIRERKRIRHIGIVEYFWAPNSTAILFPANGCLFLYSLVEKTLRQVTQSEVFATDIQFSPNGEYLSYVANQNIFCIHIESKKVTALTSDGGGTISNGIAEFIAQEEMHRFEAYWWSPDSAKIAFTQTDESPIEVSQRYEIESDSFGVFDQRYPFAGTPNAWVRVGIVSIAHSPLKAGIEAGIKSSVETQTVNANAVASEKPHIEWVALDSDRDGYVCRVNWLSNSTQLAIQIQARNQQKLELKIWDCNNTSPQQAAKTVLTETSETWVNLHNCFTSLKDPNLFIWASEKSGFNHLYVESIDGDHSQQLTNGNWVVQSLLGCDEESSLVFFAGLRDTPLESQLYSVKIANGSAQENENEPQLISAPGFNHQFQPSKDATYFIDRFSNSDQPPAVNLIDATGHTIVEIYVNSLDNTHPFKPYVAGRAEIENGTLEADDGQQLHYRLLKPQSTSQDKDSRFPVIVVVYGGPGVQRVQQEWIPPWYHYMTQRGYGILQLDNRGTTNRGVKFESAIYQTLGDIEVRDQLTGVTYLKTLPWVDPERLGVFGHSYGGYMTLMLMMKSPDTFKAGISVAPVTDWGLYDTHYTERYLGLPSENQGGYAASNVFPYVSELKGQLLVIHGMADDNVLFTNSTKLYKALQDENLPFEIMNYPGSKHGLTGRKVNLHRYNLMDRFFDKHLGF